MSSWTDDSAWGILKMFPTSKLMELHADFKKLFEVWVADEIEEKELQENCVSELNQIRLLHTAIELSRIAHKHAKEFNRVIERHPNFYVVCEKIAKEENEKSSAEK